MEAVEESAKKTKSFFIYAVDNWDAEFYAKVNDDVYVNLGMWFLNSFFDENDNASLVICEHKVCFFTKKSLRIRRNHIHDSTVCSLVSGTEECTSSEK